MTDDLHENANKARPQFSLTTLLLLPVGIAVMGTVGVWVGWGAVLFLIPICLGIVAACSGRVTGVEALVVVVFLYVLIALLLPTMQIPHGPHPKARCSNNLKWILLALHNYHDVYGSLPPAYVADNMGKPMHSWRVLILPFLEEEALYDRYDFDEPWDGPNNSLLASEIVALYNCPKEPGTPSTSTSYLLVTGGETAWHNDVAPSLADMPDGISNTIAVAEVANSGIHWMEPRDLDMDQALRGVNAPAGLCIRSNHPDGAQVGLADGSVRYISKNISPASLRALLTADGDDSPGSAW